MQGPKDLGEFGLAVNPEDGLEPEIGLGGGLSLGLGDGDLHESIGGIDIDLSDGDVGLSL